MAQINAVIFDLDNVLYDERQYINNAFKNIADFLSKKSHYTEEEIQYKLRDHLNRKGTMYSRLFNDVLSELGLKQTLLHEILGLYASVNMPLNLYPEAKQVLIDLKNAGLKLALLTNGLVQVQKNKIRLLDLQGLFDVIVYAREVSSLEKPNPELYKFICNKLSLEFKRTLCLGDNPYTDFWGANRLGIHTARLMLGEFRTVRLSQDYEAEHNMDRLEDIKKIIQFNTFI
ncbi:MAG: HAD family hydrolase [Candidatus Bathyarchaeia archaeon]|jgi:putative hydrolase of the HAD superfamily